MARFIDKHPKITTPNMHQAITRLEQAGLTCAGIALQDRSGAVIAVVKPTGSIGWCHENSLQFASEGE